MAGTPRRRNRTTRRQPGLGRRNKPQKCSSTRRVFGRAGRAAIAEPLPERLRLAPPSCRKLLTPVSHRFCQGCRRGFKPAQKLADPLALFPWRR